MAQREIELPQGKIRYEDTGAGEPIVFVHGLLVDGRLWRNVIAELERDFRCIAPDLPLGSHRTPLRADADLSPPGLARLIADFIEALGLERVTLVGNDTGGALCQLVVTRHPERIARLVLTSCDAYEHFPPKAIKPFVSVAARVPGFLLALMQGTRLRVVRNSPLAFGLLVKRPIPPEVTGEWVLPVMSDRGVRRDCLKVLKGISSRYTEEAAERLRGFDRPALIAWAAEDRIFPRSLAERLARDLPDARLEWVDDSRTFVPEDQPKRLAELIAGFVREPTGEPLRAS
jgi:pimeloyl-ACP methyl ester carboxylesterase